MGGRRTGLRALSAGPSLSLSFQPLSEHLSRCKCQASSILGAADTEQGRRKGSDPQEAFSQRGTGYCTSSMALERSPVFVSQCWMH
jgi:hypothetical protein